MTTVAKSLSTALDIVSAPTKRPKQYQHSFVMLSCRGGHSMNLETRNDRLQMLAPCECQSDPFEALVHADYLIKALVGLDGAITLTGGETGLVVKSGSRRITVPTLPINQDNWYPINRPAVDHRLLLDTATVGKSMFQAANLAKTAALQEFQVVNLVSSKSGVGLYGTNRKSLIELVHRSDSGVAVDAEIPYDVAHLIASLADSCGAKDFTLGIGEKHLTAAVNSIEIVASLPATRVSICSTWQKFKAAVTEEFSRHVLPADSICNAIASAARVNEDIHLKLGEQVEVSASKDQSEFYDSITPIEKKGDTSATIRSDEASMAFTMASKMESVAVGITSNFATVSNPNGTFYLALVRK